MHCIHGLLPAADPYPQVTVPQARPAGDIEPLQRLAAGMGQHHTPRLDAGDA